MILEGHSELRGTHALFSPSQSSWLRYDEDKISRKIIENYRAPLGTDIHEFAALQIRLAGEGVPCKITSTKNLISAISTYIYEKYTLKDPDNLSMVSYGIHLIRMLRYLREETLETIKEYINDAITYRMIPECVVYYSDAVYGTADALVFKNQFLRIHDLKTGDTPGKMEQLEGYASLYLLEHGIKPSSVQIELRIYQAGEVVVFHPTVEDILPITDQIVTISRIYEDIKKQEE